MYIYIYMCVCVCIGYIREIFQVHSLPHLWARCFHINGFR